MIRTPFIVTILLLIIVIPAFSKTSRVYEYWLNNFLLEKVKEQVKDPNTADRISSHLKSKLNSYSKVRDILKKFSHAEFSQPDKYFNKDLIKTKTTLGKKIKDDLNKELTKIEKVFGVDRNILLAIWANETFYGKVKPNLDGLQTLSILSFASKDRIFFLKEFLYLIDIIEENKIEIKKLKTSTSGALGQPQFLPSTFLRFGVDFDNDNKINIWDSNLDSLASIANYLNVNGWRKKIEWGFEVKIPKSLNCFLEGPDHSRSLSQWVKLGISRASKKEFPEKEKNKSYNLLLPSGTYGPIYLVSENFYVLKKYNNSDLYALSVAFLSDKLKYNHHDFYANWKKTRKINKTEVTNLQNRLSENYDVGGIDGLIGYKTRRAIGLYQRKHNKKETCWPPL